MSDFEPTNAGYIEQLQDERDAALEEAKRERMLMDALQTQLSKAEVALQYIARPTMALSGGADPEYFALNVATEREARLALSTCIRAAASYWKEYPRPGRR